MLVGNEDVPMQELRVCLTPEGRIAIERDVAPPTVTGAHYEMEVIVTDDPVDLRPATVEEQAAIVEWYRRVMGVRATPVRAPKVKPTRQDFMRAQGADGRHPAPMDSKFLKRQANRRMRKAARLDPVGAPRRGKLL